MKRMDEKSIIQHDNDVVSGDIIEPPVYLRSGSTTRAVEKSDTAEIKRLKDLGWKPISYQTGSAAFAEKKKITVAVLGPIIVASETIKNKTTTPQLKP